MKQTRHIFTALLVLTASLALVGCDSSGTSDTSVGAGAWPVVDQIYFDVKMQEDIGIKDVAEGKSDIFLQGVDGGTFKGLPDDVKDQVDVYAVPSSYWSLVFNPYPNAAPYTGKSGGKVVFNPMAIKELRFAMNFLINRKQMVDEILAGAGGPMYTPAMPGQPNSSQFDLIANKSGFSPTGNEAKAVADITAAMTAAAALPENAGKLKKDGQFWTFNGEPVTIKFMIRVDDPNGRLKQGRYIADQIEKAGIKVDRLEWDRKKCIQTAYQTNPADLEWGIYTEGWIGGQTYAFWDTPVTQMYAPWYSNMPGNGEASYWNYTNAEIDALTQDVINGRYRSVEDYYTKILPATETGLKEAVRIFIAYQNAFYAANKDRFESRMVYGLGDGINDLSLYTANVKPVNGKRILRVSQFSARGTLFSGAWDPVGVQGFNDFYSTNVAKPLSDWEYEGDPVTGLYYPVRMSHKDLKTDFEIAADGKLSGKIPVDTAAEIWNAKTQKWEKGISYVDKGDGVYDYVSGPVTAYSSARYTYNGGKWHHGREISQVDFRYQASLALDLSVKKSETDLVYESSYASTANPNLVRSKGIVYHTDGSFTSYFDANFPMDLNYLAALGSPNLNLKPDNRGVTVSWEVAETLKLMVVEGAASGTKWTLGSAEGLTEVDVLSEACVKDMVAKLGEMIARKHVPAALVGFVSADEAVKSYQLTLDFVNKYGHGYISNGGFFLEKYDPTNNSAIATAFREGYPLRNGYVKNLATSYARIETVKVPAYEAGKDLEVSAIVSTVLYPANKAKGAEGAKVTISLVADSTRSYSASSAKAGSYAAVIPAADLAVLQPGTYTVVIEAALANESPAVTTATIVIN